MHKTGEKTRIATAYDVFTEFKRYLEETSANNAADSWKAIEVHTQSKHGVFGLVVVIGTLEFLYYSKIKSSKPLFIFLET